MIRRTLFPTCLAIVAALAAAHSSRAATLSSTFDSNAESWTTNPTSNLLYQSTGGNPGGFIRLTEGNSLTLDNEAIAPSVFLGDQSAFNGGTISFDARVNSIGQIVLPTWGVVEITGAGESAFLGVADSASFNWTTYSAPLTSAAWGVTEAVWQAILADVDYIGVMFELYLTAESADFDNFALSTEPLSVPEPSTAALCMIGLGILVAAPLRKRLVAFRARRPS